MRWLPINLRLARQLGFRLIRVRNTQKGGSSKSFACSPKRGTFSNIALKARLTVRSASPEKINSLECKDRYANNRFEAHARCLGYRCGAGASICWTAVLRGTGDTDYLCGNCGFVIASGTGSRKRVAVDIATCSACGAENEFPPELRS